MATASTAGAACLREVDLAPRPREARHSRPRASPASARTDVVRAAGAKVAFDESIGAALEGNLPRENLSSRTAAAHLLYLLADHAGGGLQYKLTGDALVLGAVLPNG